MPESYPFVCAVVLDTPNARILAEFYRQLLGLIYRPGDEPPATGEADPLGQDWLVLTNSDGRAQMAFQQVAEVTPATWPEATVPQQMHLDFGVRSSEELAIHHERALSLGATLLEDRSQDPSEALNVYADPAGHPFCLLVGAASV